jgi:hypothetical protein
MVASGIRGNPTSGQPSFGFANTKGNTMDSNQVAQGEPPNQLENTKVPLQVKLAAAWTSFMFLYIYVDYLHLYKPGALTDILAGVVFEFDISQTFVVIALTSVAIPMFMILLSMTLPARVNRAINLVVASLYIPYSAFNLAGGEWMAFYGLGVALEVLLLAFILRSAWTWPRLASSRTATDAVATPHALATSAG